MSVYSVGGTAAGIRGSAAEATGTHRDAVQREGDAGMSLGDFQSLASALGLSQSQATQDFKRWDTDGNGVLSNDELLKGLVGKSGTSSPLAQQFLRAIDGMKDLSMDGDGTAHTGTAASGSDATSAAPAAPTSSGAR